MQLSKNGNRVVRAWGCNPGRLTPANLFSSGFHFGATAFARSFGAAFFCPALRVKKMVGVNGVEPLTPRLSSACSNQLSYTPVSNVELRMMNAERLKPVLHSKVGGAEEIRTPDL